MMRGLYLGILGPCLGLELSFLQGQLMQGRYIQTKGLVFPNTELPIWLMNSLLYAKNPLFWGNSVVILMPQGKRVKQKFRGKVS